MQSIQKCFMGPYHPNGGPRFVSCWLARAIRFTQVFFRGEKACWVELFGRNLGAMLGIRMDENVLIFFCLNPDRRSKSSNFEQR